MTNTQIIASPTSRKSSTSSSRQLRTLYLCMLISSLILLYKRHTMVMILYNAYFDEDVALDTEPITTTNNNTAATNQAIVQVNTIHQEKVTSASRDHHDKKQQEEQLKQKQQQQQIAQYWSDHKSLLKPNAADRAQRCHKITTNCPCPKDPTQPRARDSKDWYAHHDDIIRDVIRAQVASNKTHSNYRYDDDSSSSSLRQQQQQTFNLDLVMLGDSITERWNGTSGMGARRQPGMRQVYESKFTTKGGGTLEGLALGSAGDTSGNLLWHLHHGLYQQEEQQKQRRPQSIVYPKVWLVLIGSNDLFIHQCTNAFVLAGILNVVKVLQEAQPNAQIVIHGILPRKFRTEPYVGEYWDRAQAINRQLASIASEQTNLHYMEAPSVFLLPKPGTTNATSKQIDSSLMADGVHPTIRGLELWADVIVTYIAELLFEQEKLS